MAESRKKSYIIPLLYIVSALLLVGIVFFLVSEPDPCSSNTNTYEKEQCITEYIILNQSVKDCIKVSSHDLREYCISEIATKIGNAQICSLLANNSRFAFITGIARQTADITLCDSIPHIEWNSICLNELAILTNNSIKCLEIADPELHDDCIFKAMPKHDTGFCSSMVKQENMNKCIRDIALETGNASLCMQIQEGMFRDSQCFKKLAQKKKDRSYCDMILYIPVRINCYENVLGIVLVEPATRQITNISMIKKLGLNIPEKYYR